jgi:hypothetical protein
LERRDGIVDEAIDDHGRGLEVLDERRALARVERQCLDVSGNSGYRGVAS